MMNIENDLAWLVCAVNNHMNQIRKELCVAGVREVESQEYGYVLLSGPKDYDFEHHIFPNKDNNGWRQEWQNTEELFISFVVFLDSVLLRHLNHIAIVGWRVKPEVNTTYDFEFMKTIYSIYCRISTWKEKIEI